MTSMATNQLNIKYFVYTGLLICITCISAKATTRNVPSQYSTIQLAINAASNQDEIVIASGVYSELLNIDKALRFTGAGMGSTIIRYYTQTQSIITIDGNSLSSSDTVTFKNLTITGGDYIAPDIFFDVSAKGIESIDANVKLDNVSLNFISNYGITIEDGSIVVNNIQLFPDYLFYTFQCDVGLNIKNSAAFIQNLSQTRGNVDHTIDINSYSTIPIPLFSDVFVKSSTIRSSELSWGECIRTYGNSHVLVTDCNFYRPPGGAPVQTQGHSGIGINGPYANVWVNNTSFDSLPWGMQIHGSFVNSNQIAISECTFSNSEEGGIQVRNANYKILDLGGGNYGSPGSNQFSNNNSQDVVLFQSTGTVYAFNNIWSNNGNPDAEIHDQLDDSSLGKVIHNLNCQTAFSMANGNRITGSIFGQGIYETDGIIESTQEIIKPGNIIYDSGLSIDLLPGFSVKTGAMFNAFINGCGN